MEIKKINLDRKHLTVEQIKSKQNFNKILEGAHLNKPEIWKSPWFYGAIGLTSFASFMLLSTEFETKKEFNVKTYTLVNNPIQVVNAKAIRQVRPPAEVIKRLESKKDTEKNPTKIQNEAIDIKGTKIEIKEPEYIVLQDKKVTGLPSIGGVSNGIIKSSILNAAETIESGFDFKINAYKVNYFNGFKEVEERLEGNTLSLELRVKLVSFNLGDIIFFTEMQGVDNLGINHYLPPMNLRIIEN
jgi:hypothetical protein